MASLAGLSSFHPYRRALHLSPTSHSLPSLLQSKGFNQDWSRRSVFRLNNSQKQPTDTEEPLDIDTQLRSKPSSSESESQFGPSISSYIWCAGLGGLGFLETSYLAFLKLSGSDAFCLTGDVGSCNDILNSDYSRVFGVPLPFFGMIAYGAVSYLGLQLAQNNSPFAIGERNARLILAGATTSMAAASTYFLYILSTNFAGDVCLYCITSAILSFSLFSIIIKDLAFEEMQKMIGLQLSVAGLVIAALSASYTTSQPPPSSFAEDLPYFSTEITTHSSPLALSLARHLHSIGAKVYGAFWCSHCLDQKQMFGREAAELLDYVECFPNGLHKGTKIEKACAEVGIEGFPTWVINGQVLSGEKDFSELAELSGFNTESSTQSK